MKILVSIITVVIMGTFMSNIKGSITDFIDLFRKSKSVEAPLNTAAASSIYDFKAKTLDGKEINLNSYKGKKIIILNVASECGYTPQYGDWQKFYEANKANTVVLGFPANNFGGQEPGSNATIATFCKKNYGVTFPIFEKISVSGKDKAPIYQWLTDKKANGWNSQEPTWNFCKYLINEKGQLTNFFDSQIKPTSAQFLAAYNK